VIFILILLLFFDCGLRLGCDFFLGLFLFFLFVIPFFALFLDHRVADSLQVGRIQPLFYQYRLLCFKSLYFFSAPLSLTPFSQLSSFLQRVLGLLYEDSLDFEFDATQFDDVMLFEGVGLFDVAIGDVSHDQVYFLKCIVGVLQLLPRLRILQVHILRHVLFALRFIHFRQPLNFGRLYHVSIAHLTNVEQDLGLTTIELDKVIIDVMKFAVLADPDHAHGFLSLELLLLAVARLVVEEALGVATPRQRLHIEHVASHVLVVPVPVLVLFWYVAPLTVICVVLDAFVLHLFNVFVVFLNMT